MDLEGAFLYDKNTFFNKSFAISLKYTTFAPSFYSSRIEF